MTGTTPARPASEGPPTTRLARSDVMIVKYAPELASPTILSIADIGTTRDGW